MIKFTTSDKLIDSAREKLFWTPVYSGAVKAGHRQLVGWWVRHGAVEAFGATKDEALRNLKHKQGGF